MKLDMLKMLLDGITVEKVSAELDYRENSNMNWDDGLFEYTTEELEEFEQALS